MKGSYLAEIFLHGESTETFCICIGVPNKKALHELASSKGIEGSFDELCRNDQIRAEVLANLTKVGKEAGLAGFEQAKNIYLDSQSFVERGVVTNTMKIQRHEAKKAYR